MQIFEEGGKIKEKIGKKYEKPLLHGKNCEIETKIGKKNEKALLLFKYCDI